MAWNFAPDRAIYLQLVEQIQTMIVSGIYRPGDKIPSVRELAEEAAVNPNTMQRAFTELERSGLIMTQRTSGRTVSEDEVLIKTIQNKLAKEQTAAYVNKITQLGVTKQEMIEMVKEYVGGEGNE